MKKYKIIEFGKAINKRGQIVNIQPVNKIDERVGRILSITDHPNITFFDFFKENSTLYIASEDLPNNLMEVGLTGSIFQVTQTTPNCTPQFTN